MVSQAETDRVDIVVVGVEGVRGLSRTGQRATQELRAIDGGVDLVAGHGDVAPVHERVAKVEIQIPREGAIQIESEFRNHAEFVAVEIPNVRGLSEYAPREGLRWIDPVVHRRTAVDFHDLVELADTDFRQATHRPRSSSRFAEQANHAAVEGVASTEGVADIERRAGSRSRKGGRKAIHGDAAGKQRVLITTEQIDAVINIAADVPTEEGVGRVNVANGIHVQAARQSSRVAVYVRIVDPRWRIDGIRIEKWCCKNWKPGSITRKPVFVSANAQEPNHDAIGFGFIKP